MRLEVVSRGHRPAQRALLGLMKLGPGGVPDVVRALAYRPELWGGPFSVATQAVMRGPSDWSVGERELFAAFVSDRNRCRFCAMGHEATAAQALGDDLVAAALADPEHPSLRGEVRAALGLVEKLTLDPGQVGADDVGAVTDAGVSAEAVVDAIAVCALFCAMNRVADALDFELPSVEAYRRMAPMLLRVGYRGQYLLTWASLLGARRRAGASADQAGAPVK